MKENQITEHWVPAVYIRENGTILDFTGLYEVSDLGRVRSLNYNHTGKIKILTPRVLKGGGTTGLLTYGVNLRKNNKRHHLLIHRLVLSSFDPTGFKPGHIVNHKIERTATSCINTLSNLEWISQKDNTNTLHCIDAHTNHPALSKRVKVTNLTTGETTVYPSVSESERAFGLSHIVSDCIKLRNGYLKRLNLHFAYV